MSGVDAYASGAVPTDSAASDAPKYAEFGDSHGSYPKFSHVHAPFCGPVFICSAHMTAKAVLVSALSRPDSASRVASTSALITDSISRVSLVFGIPRVWSG